MERETLEQRIARAYGEHFKARLADHDLWVSIAASVREWLLEEHADWHGDSDCDDGCEVYAFLVDLWPLVRWTPGDNDEIRAG